MLLVFLLVLQLRSAQVNAFLPAQPIASIGRPLVCTTKPPADSLRVSTSNINTDQPPSADDTTTVSSPKRKKGIQPLTQNWWPVSLLTALNQSKPNPIALLDQKLVLWYDNAGDGQWSCLDDRCAHRFAPLSEGRVVNDGTSSCLQCAYHGWSYGGGGGCTRIPQASDDHLKDHKLCSVRSYPIKECGGMIWVWADPATEPNEDQDPQFRVSSLLRRFHESGGTARGFQRDLPYGFEYLGENLADISHLPFSHHAVGTLNRVDGRPVPLEMLSEAEKVDTAKLQKSQHRDKKVVLPLYQARVLNAAEHDPEIVAALKYNPVVIAEADPKLATSTIGFHDPCHIRYHRNQGIPGSSYEIDLFMSPTTEGNSRVFLFTPFEKFLPKEVEGDESSKQSTVEKTKYRPSGLMQGTANKLFRRTKTAFPPYIGHMIAHQIFDGDGIFLNKQGDRMRRANLSYKDYHTPTSSDVIVNAFRRWLDKAAEVTRAAGLEEAARSAIGGNDADSVYKDNRPRAELLDRYASHTANCNI